MIPKTSHSNDPNARPCYLHGHVWRGYSDFSKTCLSCGLYIGPDIAQVETLIREGAGGAEYRRQAAALRMLMPLPVAPKIPSPPPAVLKNVDGAGAEPLVTLPLLTIGAALVGAVAAFAAIAGVHLADWMSGK